MELYDGLRGGETDAPSARRTMRIGGRDDSISLIIHMQKWHLGTSCSILKPKSEAQSCLEEAGGISHGCNLLQPVQTLATFACIPFGDTVDFFEVAADAS